MTIEKNGPPPKAEADHQNSFTPPHSTVKQSRETIWGAPPGAWHHFVELGLTADLLPVVSDPAVPISPHSKMTAIGKTPSRINGSGHVAGIKDWTQKTTTPEEIARWSADDRHGICLQTRRARAIDVDVEDADTARTIADTIREQLGVELPRRGRADSPKFLLAFALPGDYTKRIIRVDAARKWAIEFLATGQQFVAAGTHPKGARYEWEGGLPESLPPLTAEQFEALWALLAARFSEDGKSVTQRAGKAPDRPRTAADADDPLVAFLSERWTVFAHDRSGRVDILCPFAERHTDGASEGSSTSYFPAGVGGFDRGHFRCLHASCTDRDRADFEYGIGWSTEGFDVIELPEGELMPELTRRDNGTVPPSRANLSAALRTPAYCGTRIRHDEFSGGVVIGDEARPLRDADYTNIALHLETRWKFGHIPRELLRELVVHTADGGRFDSAIEWLRGLTWDRVPRVETFASTYLRAGDTPYTRAVSRYLWTALAGRVLVPGIKADMVPVLIGDQGEGKSRTCAALVPHDDHFAELDLKKDDDALARAVRGKLVAELPELAGISKRELEHLKAWVTRRVEKWVPKYMEAETSYPRRCVFIGTTNIEKPLPADPTGQRRWLPVEVGACDVEGIERDRLQLWAEGAALFDAHGIQWQDAERLARDVNSEYVEEDEWTETVAIWLSTGADFDPADERPRVDGWLAEVTSTEVVTGALRLSPDKINASTGRRISAVLQALGYTKLKRASGRKAGRGTAFARKQP